MAYHSLPQALVSRADMVQFVEHIIAPYVEKVRESHSDDTLALQV